MSASRQLNLPPTEVKAVNHVLNRFQVAPVKSVNWLRIARTARERAQLKLAAMAEMMGISEPLLSAQLSDHEDGKHLSMRRLGRVNDASFLREFALLLLEDLGLSVIVVTVEQKAALDRLQAASADYARVSAAR